MKPDFDSKAKSKARSAVYCALKSGILTKEPCEVCGAEKTSAHHIDCSKPLEVRWLCRIHHGWEHGQMFLSVNTKIPIPISIRLSDEMKLATDKLAKMKNLSLTTTRDRKRRPIGLDDAFRCWSCVPA
jgi:hypothetical protein